MQCVMLMFATSHLYTTCKVHSGTCKDEIESPIWYIVHMVVGPNATMLLHSLTPTTRIQIWNNDVTLTSIYSGQHGSDEAIAQPFSR